MTTAARAARSEQTAQTPPPRRRLCDAEQPTILPRDPNLDLAIRPQYRATLGAILAKTHGNNRHLVWACNRTLMRWTGLSKSALDRHLRVLLDAKRIERYVGRDAVDRWFLETAAQHGPKHAIRPAWMPEDCDRLIVIVAWMPAVVCPKAYGPLALEVDRADNLSASPENGVPLPPGNGVPSAPEMGCPIEKGIPLEGETLMKSSSTTIDAPEIPATIDDGMLMTQGGEELLPEDLRADLRLPQGHPARRAAEGLLRSILRRSSGNQPNPSRSTTFVESPSAGHERSVLAFPASQVDHRTPEPADAPGGRISRPTAERIADAVRVMKVGDHDQAERILSGLISALDATGDSDLVAIYSEAIHMAADGQLVDAVTDAIRQAPNGQNPRGLLKSKFRSLLAAKNPPPGPLTKVPRRRA